MAADNAEKAWADARTARDAEIEAADVDGASIRRIAREAGLSPSHVDRIVARRTAARQDRLLTATGLTESAA
ncbi:MAG: hypothetical protein AUG44_03405 [Actinobacteria bacterium 13_1_20CM_3_71_11]|nr:MAG: hypothetical protein AUG44_03405 [Actinobacteria bacterium 13_1_20CM_3_71_11]